MALKEIYQDARERLKELDETLETIAVASLEKRAKGLKKAVEDGWFKHFLIGAGLVGASLVYTGLSNDNDYVAGLGYGALAMNGIYAFGCYGLPALRKNRTDSQ